MADIEPRWSERGRRVVSKKSRHALRRDELSDDEQQSAIQSLMDADEYDRAAKLADEAITEAVARYLHDAMLEKEERQAGNELT